MKADRNPIYHIAVLIALVAAAAALAVIVGSPQTQAQTAAATATPTPELIHSASRCHLVVNDLELLRAMYSYRGIAFPTRPDALRPQFFNPAGEAVVPAPNWTMKTLADHSISGTGAVGAAGYAEYLRFYHAVLKDARKYLIATARPEASEAQFPMQYHVSPQWTHVDWYLLDTGHRQVNDERGLVRSGFVPKCYHLDTNPQDHERQTPTPTVTPIS